MDAIRIPWWGEITTYEGAHVDQLDLDEFLTTHTLSEIQSRDPHLLSFFNLNTPEDVGLAQKMIFSK